VTRVVHISPIGTLGGIAEVIRAELPVLRRFGVETTWLTLRVPPGTKVSQAGLNLVRALYGADGCAHVDRAGLMDPDLPRVLAEFGRAEAQRLAPQVAGADLVVLHDPLCLSLAPALRPLTGAVLWRCHVGHDEWHSEAAAAALHLRPFTEHADLVAFLRRGYRWPGLDDTKVTVVPPGLNPELAKNRELSPEFLARTGPALLTGGTLPGGDTPGRPLEEHGTGYLADPMAPILVQVARWDPLKGLAGLAATFAETVALAGTDAELVLVQPHIDPRRHFPENTTEMRRLLALRAALPAAVRRKVHVWSFPGPWNEQESLTVNVLQRAATVVAQNSLREGFGLTVTEAMWKRRAVVATAVGGIAEQIEHRVSGLLAAPSPTGGVLANPELGGLLAEALSDPDGRQRMGQAAHEVVRSRYLAEQTVRLQLTAVGMDSHAGSQP
jgi:trehalose synthase